jgi:hypothetical protein
MKASIGHDFRLQRDRSQLYWRLASFELARRPDRPLVDESSASKDANYGPKDENYNYARRDAA